MMIPAPKREFSHQSQIDELLQKLESSEKLKNEHITEIFSRLDRSDNSALPLIVRGIATKNRKILVELKAAIEQIHLHTETELEVFKKFVNEFLISYSEPGIAMLQKYLAHLKSHNLSSNDIFLYPITSLEDYTHFIDCTTRLLRNPFIIGRLVELKESLIVIMKDLELQKENKSLNNITFDSIRSFNATSASSRTGKVAVYFKITDIIERSKNAEFYLKSRNTLEKIELVILRQEGSSFRAMALLSVPEALGRGRELIYPPFRVNELGMHLAEDETMLSFFSLSSFSRKCKNANLEIISHEKSALKYWHQKLLSIFPRVEKTDLDSFSLLDYCYPDVSMRGLGIDVSSNPEGQSYLTNSVITNSTEKARTSRISRNMVPNKSEGTLGRDTACPANGRSLTSSQRSLNLLESQYSHSLDIINGNLQKETTNIATASQGSKEPHSYIKLIKRDTILSLTSNFNAIERPVSSKGELDYVESSTSPEPYGMSGTVTESESSFQNPDYSNKSNNFFYHKPKSETDLLEKKPKLTVLSNGSAINLNEFGKGYNPSFDSLNLSGNKVNNSEIASRQKGFFDKLFRSNTDSIKGRPSVSEQTSSTSLPDESISSSNLLNAIENDSASFHKESSEASISSSTLNEHVSAAKNTSPNSPSFEHKEETMKTDDILNESEKLLKVEEDREIIKVPSSLKKIINSSSSSELYITNSFNSRLRVSVWNNDIGSWKGLTENDTISLKIVHNRASSRCWLLVFKVQSYQEFPEGISQPILILEINHRHTSIRQSSPLDMHINSKNSVTNRCVTVLVRSRTGEGSNHILNHLKKANEFTTFSPINDISAENELNSPISSAIESVIDSDEIPSASSTVTNISSLMENDAKNPMKRKTSVECLTSSMMKASRSNEIQPFLRAAINEKRQIASNINTRLQLQLEGYESIKSPSAWKILGMCKLSLQLINNTITNQKYYYISLVSDDLSIDQKEWLFSKEDKLKYVEQIGKAGLLVKTQENIHMIEFKGKKEFKSFFSLLV